MCGVLVDGIFEFDRGQKGSQTSPTPEGSHTAAERVTAMKTNNGTNVYLRALEQSKVAQVVGVLQTWQPPDGDLPKIQTVLDFMQNGALWLPVPVQPGTVVQQGHPRRSYEVRPLQQLRTGPGGITIVSEPEFVGRIPPRTEITVLGPDRPAGLLGWRVRETVGVGAINPTALTRLVLNTGVGPSAARLDHIHPVTQLSPQQALMLRVRNLSQHIMAAFTLQRKANKVASDITHVVY